MRYLVQMPGHNFKILFELAADNYGFVTVEDARRVGIRPQRLAEMAARGALRREGFGVYRLDPFPEHQLDGYRKATLWPHRAEGILSHETALELYELGDVSPAKIHLTVPAGHRVRHREVPPLYRLHREDLDPHDITRFEGIPIVTPAKALRQAHDAGLRRDLLRQGLDQARHDGLVSRSDYDDLMHEFGFDPAAAPSR